MSTVDNEEKSLAGLLRDLRDESTHLVKQEVRLAKTELGDTVSRVGRNIGYLFAGALVAYSGFVVFLVGLGFMLTTLLENAGMNQGVARWLGPLLVGLVILAVGFALVVKAVKTIESSADHTLERTARSLEADKEFAERKIEDAT